MPRGTITVLYPALVQFNMDYYLSKHMIMVHNNLKSFGMTGWRVSKNLTTGSGGESPYAVTCELYLDSLEDFKKGMEKHGEEILGDVSNFSDKEPVLMVGELSGTS